MTPKQTIKNLTACFRPRVGPHQVYNNDLYCQHEDLNVLLN